MLPGERDKWLPGVLSKNQIKGLKDSYIDGIENFDEAADYSSIDLYLSAEGYKMLHGSVKPSSETPYIEILKDKTIAQRLAPNDNGVFILEPETCYVFKLKESLNNNLCQRSFKSRPFSVVKSRPHYFIL